ncbi:hypothetical protein TrLO_g3977 [Triparma laevis f. longispina]|uniref:Dynein heavy chain n=3 Tax=Triparma laevis TaxID=1534972 RepID=A0A9W7DMM4_9STRA|nr:hypothetical protein TrLO_g3977 [Triparma laevis f. longispina]
MADDNADAAPVLKKADLGTRSHRCNARPINPFESAETPSQEILAEVFESSGWKRDASHKCANQDKIMASLTELGPESPYVTAIDEATGITGIHAAAVNGYTDLLKAFMDLGQVDPLIKCTGLSTKVSWVKRQCGAGVDCLWLGRRRGHKAIVDHLLAMPVVQVEIERFETALVEKHAELNAAELQRQAEAEAARLKAEEEERQRQEEERKRKEFEKAQRKFRDEIIKYDGKIRLYKKEVEKKDFIVHATGVDAALVLITTCKKAHATQVKEQKIYLNKAKPLELEDALNKSEATLEGIGDTLDHYTLLWELHKEVDAYIAQAASQLWADLKPETMEEEARALVTRTKKLPKPIKESDAYIGVDKIAKDFFKVCPLVSSLCTPAMRERHWQEIMDGCGTTFTLPDKDPTMTLQTMLDLDLGSSKNSALVEEVCDKAQKEAKQEVQLKTLGETWTKVELTSTMYGNTDVPLIKMKEDDFEVLEADLLILQGMVASRYDFWKEQSSKWQKELVTLSDVLATLSELQRMWSYLEPLFIQSDEVKKELPETAVKFAEVDKTVRATLKQMWKDKNAQVAANKDGLLKSLEGMLHEQELCKKALSDFIDGKRRLFPRFYFVSEADLLDILSNASNPTIIMKHVDKVMLQTKTFMIDSPPAGTRPTASTWISGVGVENVDFEPPIKLEGKVENYLQASLDGQMSSLAKCLARSYKVYPTIKRTEWMMRGDEGKRSDPVMITLLAGTMYYVLETEAAQKEILAGGDPTPMEKHCDNVKNQLKDLIVVTSGKLNKSDRTRVMVMITMDAHSRDIVEKLIFEKALANDDFQWQSQLKQKYEEDPIENGKGRGNAFILNASFYYDFEYLGNGGRLVVTPLTDRIYVTATQALHLSMGCAPAGPAGTGKTESTKDLANALGKCCYVFNCSPEMDYQSLGNIFKGLSSSGAWGCFDEFNRLIPEVLSVCSVQYKCVTDGIAMYKHEPIGSKKIMIEGDMVTLNQTTGAYITMNPGYLGRSALPEGLKALFRPMTVMTPDLVLICENMMMAEGFTTAKSLATKFFTLYNLLKDLLSKQEHYDWGLRAIKSVLVVAGQLKRSDPDSSEDAVLMRALRDFNVPKIVQVDEIVFHGLLGDLFPGLNPERKVDKKLEDCVKDACESLALFPHETFVLKCVQLDELLEIRHCVFTMGPPTSGKTTCTKALQEARRIKFPEPTEGERGGPVKIVDVNPKVMDTQDLYGYINLATRDWKDGLLSTIMRDLGQIPDDLPKWILLDGDLDANWIESMNSVMDDNRMLTLASNERIPLKPNMRMIFEIRDLTYATPATVSRAGILYISTDEGFQWRCIIASWIKKLPKTSWLGDGATPEVQEQLSKLFEDYVPETLRVLKKEMLTLVPYFEAALVGSLLRLLESTLTKQVVSSSRSLESTFVFCAIWAFGSSLGIGDDGTDYKAKFSDWWKSHQSAKGVAFPPRDTIFDYWLDPVSNVFEEWNKSPVFKEVKFDSKTMSMSELTVPTGESSSVAFWMNSLVANSYPVMLCGGAGQGKTQLINGMLGELDPDNYQSLTVSMNFYTSGEVLRSILETPMVKLSGSTFGPSNGNKMVFFIDDLNLPMVDKYNTQSGIALIRQHLDYSHWYDIQKLTLKTVTNCQYVSAMNPTAGSFLINPRLQRWFTAFGISAPNEASIMTIFTTFLMGHLETHNFEKAIMGITEDIIKGTLAVHNAVASTFRKTAANFHYVFNLRHIASVFAGLLMTTPARFNTTEKMANVWLHECERVYADRLVSPEHQATFQVLIQKQAKMAMPSFNFGKFVGDNAAPLLFSHFMDGLGEDPVYDQVVDIEPLKKALDGALEDYNETNAVMDLVLFEDAMRHICRITRVINNTAGHCMLVGVGGSGKQSLSRLSSHICGFKTQTITITSSYGINDLKADIQAMYRLAGVKQEGVMWLFTDSQIVDEKFLVYMNDLLSSGKIADLYAQDELDAVCGECFSKAKAAGAGLDAAGLYEYFISQVRKNLHVVLCFSPIGDAFRTRCLKFPALVNCTTIDWFQPWPEEALASVAQRFVADMDLGTDEIKAGITAFFPTSFSTVNEAARDFKNKENRIVHTTPKSYLELLAGYDKLLKNKREENDAASFRLSNGVAKLKECGDAVDVLKADLAIMVKDATEKSAVAAGIAKTVSEEKAVVEFESEKANEEAIKTEAFALEVSKKQADAEEDLKNAIPAVEKAMAALDTIQLKDIQSCKGMNVPPPGVDDVFGAVMVLFANVKALPTAKGLKVQKSGKMKEDDRGWAAAKKALFGDPKQFLADCKALKEAFDAGGVPSVNWKEVRPFIALEHFKPEIILTKNSAAAGLCNFVINIVIYYDIVSQVEPKKKLVAEMTVQLEEANTSLAAVKAKVKELEDKLAVLTAELKEATETKEGAEATVAKGMSKLDMANRLISALSSEKVRWTQGVKDLGASRYLLIGDCLLGAAFISYIGPFTKPFRDDLVYNKWLPILQTANAGESLPMQEPANPMSVLTSDAEIALWNSKGLPADPVSSENGSIVCRSARYPLMIDPQLQGVAWIKSFANSNEERPLQIARLGNKDLLTKLKTALENGYPMLIENMGESIDAIIVPVIQRATFKRGNKFFTKLGEDEVEFNSNFRLYLHTKLSNPNYPPEIQAECTLVNFAVTPQGLEDQLLALVVRKERPELASQKAGLIHQANEFMVKSAELEDGILKGLAESEGDITEDVALIENLEESKRVSNDIAKKLAEGKKTTQVINKTSEKYRPVARRGAQLFFVMGELVKIHTYYMYSLNAFVVVFQSGIEKVQAEDKAKGSGGIKGKMNLMKKLKSTAKKIIMTQRFNWNKDILGDAFRASPEDLAAANKAKGGGMADMMGGMMLNMQQKKAEAAAKACKVGDLCDVGNFGTGKVKEIRADGTHCVEMRWKMANGKSAMMYAKASQVVKTIDFDQRCSKLADTITSTTFNYIRRGLFERDKLTVVSLFALTLQIANDQIDKSYVDSMLMNASKDLNGEEGPLLPEEVTAWLPAVNAGQTLALADTLGEKIPEFANIVEELTTNSDAWKEWYNHANPENEKCPGTFADLTQQQRLCLIRAIRPDRATYAMSQYISDTMGSEYVFQPPFDMKTTYMESSASTPMFFVLFPGVDPTPWVEALGKNLGISTEKGTFVNISMGQGQEKPAENMLEKMAQKGGWVMLQNLHLMQSWLTTLDRKLEVCAETAHQDFRCFVSGEAPGFSYQSNMPESLLQCCIKVANEAPADLKSNIVRAFSLYDDAYLDDCSKPNEFRGCLYTLCFFHSVMVGRIRFGQMGWSRKYGFNMGDLKICSDVCKSYLNDNEVVPWKDLRYIFGEIMYGGHITDFWDRYVDNKYLEVLMQPDVVMSGGQFAPGFASPDPAGKKFADYISYTKEQLPPEAPPLYGLHPNSEIAYLMNATSSLFSTILRLSAGSGGGGGGDGGGVHATIEDILARLPATFDLITLDERAEELLTGPQAPYVLVAKQECGRMNLLLNLISNSLDELTKGLAGSLNMTQQMEDLNEALTLMEVPGRNPFHTASWEKFAWPSTKGLLQWFADSILRVDQLVQWTDTLQLPFSLWMGALFNPTSFLTAIKQVVSRSTGSALDQMSTETHFSTMMEKNEATKYPENGVYVHGIYMEGARWNTEGYDVVDVSGTSTQGAVAESRPKELYPAMPLMYIKAVPIQPSWDPQSVGYIRPEPFLYNCPVYYTVFRGPVFIFTATLMTDALNPNSCTLAGVALMFSLTD